MNNRGNWVIEEIFRVRYS